MGTECWSEHRLVTNTYRSQRNSTNIYYDSQSPMSSASILNPRPTKPRKSKMCSLRPTLLGTCRHHTIASHFGQYTSTRRRVIKVPKQNKTLCIRNEFSLPLMTISHIRKQCLTNQNHGVPFKMPRLPISASLIS